MTNSKLLWIFLVILVFGISIWYLLQQRKRILSLNANIQEGLTLSSISTAQVNELNLMKVQGTGPGLKNYNIQSLGDMPLCEFCIKSSNKSANLVSQTLRSRLYKGMVDSNTLLSKLMGKLILIVDAQVSGDYALYPVCSTGTVNCNNMGSMVNMQSNAYPLYKYSNKTLLNMLSNPPTMMDKTTSDVKVLRMVEPASSMETTNPNSNIMIKNYGVQIIENRFYMKDAYLTTYETFFSDNGSAFIPFYKAIPYLTSTQGTNLESDS